MQLQQQHGREPVAVYYFPVLLLLLHGSKPVTVDLIAPRQLQQQHGSEPLAVDLLLTGS